MSTPLIIALIIYICFLLFFIVFNLFILYQANKYSFLGDKTTLGIQIYAIFITIIILLSSFLLTLFDWTDVPTFLK